MSSRGDAGDVKAALVRQLTGQGFVAALQAVVTEKGDGLWPALPVTVYPNERTTHVVFPMAELIIYRSTFSDDDVVKKTLHQIGVRWTDVGPTEALVTETIERLTRATTDLLWDSTLDTLVASGPILVQEEDYSPLIPTPTHPFVKSSLVMIHVPVWRD